MGRLATPPQGAELEIARLTRLSATHRATLQRSTRRTLGCFLSPKLCKRQEQTSIGYVRNGLPQGSQALKLRCNIVEGSDTAGYPLQGA